MTLKEYTDITNIQAIHYSLQATHCTLFIVYYTCILCNVYYIMYSIRCILYNLYICYISIFSQCDLREKEACIVFTFNKCFRSLREDKVRNVYSFSYVGKVTYESRWSKTYIIILLKSRQSLYRIFNKRNAYNIFIIRKIYIYCKPNLCNWYQVEYHK